MMKRVQSNYYIINNNSHSYTINEFYCFHNLFFVDWHNLTPVAHRTHILYWKSNITNANIIYIQYTSTISSFHKITKHSVRIAAISHMLTIHNSNNMTHGM